ncbi:MAG: DUF1294 domain-containing protein [Clostridia bacterium]|nr:DUF1294 domain-containing protein [Clostridia bacterium]
MKINLLLLYLFAINLIAFIMAACDKRFAIHKMRRISEKTLFLTAFLGGAFGMYASMLVFHHKTRHKRFMVGLPIICVLIIAAIFWSVKSGIFY